MITIDFRVVFSDEYIMYCGMFISKEVTYVTLLLPKIKNHVVI